MQTSFMHPPFGFALFYLRGIAPREVKSSDIYLGAIPWVALQIILVAIVIIWPETVSSFLKAEKVIDPSTIELNVPMPDAEAPAGGGNPFGEEGAQNPFEQGPAQAP
jgi:hypothetical protein